MSYPRIYFTNALVYAAGVNQRDTAKTMLESQKAAYRDGLALRRHCLTQHDGVICDDCPACREIREREKLV